MENRIAPSRASPYRRPRMVNWCRCSSVQPMTAWMTGVWLPEGNVLGIDDSAHQIVFWPLSPVKDAYLFF